MGCCNIRRRRRQIKHNNNNNNNDNNNPSSLSTPPLSTSSRSLLVLLLSNDGRRRPGGGSCVLWSNNNNNNNSDENDDADDEKLICFVRHGCTYMNEYLSRTTNSYFGSPNFTDIFPSPERELYYLDTPLSERGIKQAQNLAANKLKNNNNNNNNKRSSSWTSTTTSMFPFINNKNNHRRQMSNYNDCELVVVSPLRRALQTLDYGIKPNLPNDIPIIALPEASERLYLISDVGRPLQTTMNEFPYVDFTHCISTNKDNNNSNDTIWWYTPPSHKSNNNNIEQEEEWRPIDNGQKYECSGEPEHIFMERMEQLCTWLSQRPETKITIICHHGVIYSMTNIDFYNCQWKVIPLSSCIPYNKKM